MQIRALSKLRVFIKSTIKKNEVMKPGVYKIHWAEKPILYDIDNPPALIKKAPIVFPKFLLAFFSRSIIVRGGRPKFLGEYALISLNKEMKVFSTVNKEVLSLMSPDKCEFLRFAASKLDKLNTTFLRVNEYGVVERWISNTTTNRDCIYTLFLDDYKKYITNTTIEEIRPMQDYWRKFPTKNKDIASLFDILSNRIGNERYPVVFSHCDMHLGNMLYENEILWYIDLEYARIEIFFYDVYIGMVVAFWDNGDESLLRRYLQKDPSLIIKIKEIFNAIGYPFCEESRKKYLYAFLAARLLFDLKNGKKRFGKINYMRYQNYLVKKNRQIIRFIEDVHD